MKTLNEYLKEEQEVTLKDIEWDDDCDYSFEIDSYREELKDLKIFGTIEGGY